MSLDKKPQLYEALKQPSGAFFIEARAQEVIVPALWGQDTFIEKARGSEVLEQMWTFDDKKGRPCCLIPEATALFQERVTDLLGKKSEATYFYVARCYRYERPQAGRYREFTQLGFEILTKRPTIGLEISQDLCVRFLDSLGLEYEIDIAAKRGLTYYLQGEGFEIRCPELGAQKQVVGAALIVKELASVLALIDYILHCKLKENRSDDVTRQVVYNAIESRPGRCRLS